ncbi:MAG: hypothetical protein ACYDAG_03360 [Chloroflexota bacterium]
MAIIQYFWASKGNVRVPRRRQPSYTQPTVAAAIRLKVPEQSLSLLRTLRGLACGFPAILVMAVVARSLFLLLSHTWDAQTWVNTFAELAQPGTFREAIQRPYETTRELSLLTRAAGRHGDHYESWAYPPFMLYVYWPLARAYLATGGHLVARFPVQPAFWTPSVPFALQALTRLPNVVADLVTLVLLQRLGATLSELRWYALNPFVLLIGAWTFDPVMTAFLMLGLFLAERGRWGLAGVALGFGAATKLMPIVALPALVVAVLAQPLPLAARLRKSAAAVGACLSTLGLLLAPAWDGSMNALRFQLERFGGNLSFAQIWLLRARFLPPTRDWAPAWQLYASADVGALLLPLVLLLTLWLIARFPMPLPFAMLALFLALLAGSKLVNEAYAFALMALMTAAIAQRPSPLLVALRRLFWVIPLCYTAVNTPAWGFTLSAIQQIKPASSSTIGLWVRAYQAFLGERITAIPFAVLGLGFSVLALATMFALPLLARQRSGISLA